MRLGYSFHHGWVHGHSYEVVVCSGRDEVVLPLLGSTDVASGSEHRTFGAKIGRLPPSTRHVLAYGGYDNNSHGERIEYDNEDRGTRRLFHCPLLPRAHEAKPGISEHRGKRGRSLQRRRRPHAFIMSLTGPRLFARRSRTVEPFNQ